MKAKPSSAFCLENPAQQQGKPSMFGTPMAQDLRDAYGTHDMHLDQCMYGLEHYVKPTTLLTNVKFGKPRRCNHPKGFHKQMSGLDDSGKYRTASQAEYPPKLCQFIAEGLIGHFVPPELSGACPPGSSHGVDTVHSIMLEMEAMRSRIAGSEPSS